MVLLMIQKIKSNREREREKERGKKRYLERVIEENEAEQQIKEFEKNEPVNGDVDPLITKYKGIN